MNLAPWIPGDERPWFWGPVDRSGLYQYLHLARGPGDVEPKRPGRGAATAWKAALSGKPREVWQKEILELLADGVPRTWYRISTTLWGYPADVTAGKAPDAALWELVDQGRVEHSGAIPVLFRVPVLPDAVAMPRRFVRELARFRADLNAVALGAKCANAPELFRYGGTAWAVEVTVTMGVRGRPARILEAVLVEVVPADEWNGPTRKTKGEDIEGLPGPRDVERAPGGVIPTRCPTEAEFYQGLEVRVGPKRQARTWVATGRAVRVVPIGSRDRLYDVFEPQVDAEDMPSENGGDSESCEASASVSKTPIIMGVNMGARKTATGRRKVRQMTLPDDVIAILDQVGNASEYVSRMVGARRREWGEALHLLEAEGWKRGELRAVCEALGGAHHPFGEPLPAWISGQLERAAGVPKSRRATLNQEPIARGLAVLALEWWAGNDEVFSALS